MTTANRASRDVLYFHRFQIRVIFMFRTACLRKINRLFARLLGTFLVLILKMLRHKSETLRVNPLGCHVSVIYSDMTGEQGFNEWVATFHRITLKALCILAESSACHCLSSRSAITIWIVKGGRGKSGLLGHVFVFSSPKADNERKILKFFLHDIVWLVKRNECYYRDNLSVYDCRCEATRFTKEVLDSFFPKQP